MVLLFTKGKLLVDYKNPDLPDILCPFAISVPPPQNMENPYAERMVFLLSHQHGTRRFYTANWRCVRPKRSQRIILLTGWLIDGPNADRSSPQP